MSISPVSLQILVCSSPRIKALYIQGLAMSLVWRNLDDPLTLGVLRTIPLPHILELFGRRPEYARVTPCRVQVIRAVIKAIPSARRRLQDRTLAVWVSPRLMYLPKLSFLLTRYL